MDGVKGDITAKAGAAELEELAGGKIRNAIGERNDVYIIGLGRESRAVRGDDRVIRITA